MTLTSFRPYRPRKLKLDEVGHILAQMQGVIDTEPDPDDKTEVAFRVLVEQWHAMLQAAVVDEAKRS